MSHYPKILLKMNTYLHSFITYFENVIHPAGKSDPQKAKPRSSKATYQLQTSPDSLNIRASVRKQDSVRRNPAP
jgi:hypothetical protein